MTATAILSSKVCSRCKIDKPHSAYSVHKSGKDGFRGYCRACDAEHSRAYRLANPIKVQTRELTYKANNRESIRARDSVYAKNHLEAYAKRSEKRRSRIKANGGSLSRDIAQKLLILQQGKCAGCQLPLGEKFHTDHIIPIVMGGSNTDDNIQLLHPYCNHQKHMKHPIDYMQSKGFLL